MTRQLLAAGLVVLLFVSGIFTALYVSRNHSSRYRPGTHSRSVTPGPSGSERYRFIKEGKALYHRYCVSCHGRKGYGEGPASDYLSVSPLNFHSDTAAKMNETELFKRITHGKLKSGMPAWKTKLSPRQRRQIVRYLQSTLIPPQPDEHSQSKNRGTGS